MRKSGLSQQWRLVLIGAIATSSSLPNNRRLQYHPLKKRSHFIRESNRSNRQ